MHLILIRSACLFKSLNFKRSWWLSFHGLGGGRFICDYCCWFNCNLYSSFKKVIYIDMHRDTSRLMRGRASEWSPKGPGKPHPKTSRYWSLSQHCIQIKQIKNCINYSYLCTLVQYFTFTASPQSCDALWGSKPFHGYWHRQLLLITYH